MFAKSSALIVMLIIAGLPACTAFPWNGYARRRIFSELDGYPQEFDIPSFRREVSMGDAVQIKDLTEGDVRIDPEFFLLLAECSPSDYECGRLQNLPVDYDTDDDESQDEEGNNPSIVDEDTFADHEYEETEEEEDDDEEEDEGDDGDSNVAGYSAIDESTSEKTWISEDI